MMREILARCKKCGRGFISLPGDGTMIDRYGDPDRQPRIPYGAGEWPTCGGTLELTPAGRTAIAQERPNAG